MNENNEDNAGQQFGSAINQCIAIVERYKVPVGNSAAGEMAAEWTMEALREVRDEFRALLPEKKD